MTDNHPQFEARYDKLFFLWFFDDEEGYGIEIMGLKNDAAGRRFHSVVKWSFGHGTKARDLRRQWGDYVAEQSQNNDSVIPVAILNLRLKYLSDNIEQFQRDLEKIESVLSGNLK